MIYLMLGTDKGDRMANLSRARELLSQKLSVTLQCSGIMETEAIGFYGPAFLNQAVAFEADIKPHDLLAVCQGIEAAMGRKPHKARYGKDGRRIYKPRVIDIDILMMNDLAVDTEDLTIPHPQVESRPYVKVLLQQLTNEEERSNNQ